MTYKISLDLEYITIIKYYSSYNYSWQKEFLYIAFAELTFILKKGFLMKIKISEFIFMSTNADMIFRVITLTTYLLRKYRQNMVIFLFFTLHDFAKSKHICHNKELDSELFMDI